MRHRGIDLNEVSTSTALKSSPTGNRRS